jgi:CMP-N-acetylneuraminic acid synthetase
MNILTVIPAKLGSTRIFKKNIRILGGKPLLHWTIQTALDSGCCGEVMVSTESEEVAEIARQAGAKVPFIRPEYLSKDPYEVYDVCAHAVGEYEKLGKTFDTLVLLLPTSPFRAVEDIQETLQTFIAKQASFAVSVSAFECNLFSAHVIDEDQKMTVMFPEYFTMETRKRPKPYQINGAVFVADIQALKEQKTLYGDNFYAYVMDWKRSVDIDTETDFNFAEYLLERGIVDSQERV